MSNIIIGSFYKSGSNHIADSLANLLGSHRTYLNRPGEGYAQDPQRLDPNVMAVMLKRLNGMVYLQHIMGTRANVNVIKGSGAYTIVTMRKLFACLHSLRRYEDLLVKDGTKDGKYVNDDWPAWTDHQKWMWVAYNTIPWYYQCYVSWMKADIPKHIVWFEKHFKDQVASAREICKFLNIDDFSNNQLAKAFHHKNSNYTKDRTRYNMPDFVKEIAYAQTEAWGEWKHALRRDLLED